MKIRPLFEKDRARVLSMLIKTRSFTSQEIDVAMELVDIVLKDQMQKDYQIRCAVNEQDEVIGYICYGPVPMTHGTFDLYWIVVDPDLQKQGVGSTLLKFLEEAVGREKGRLILAETSTIPHYEKTEKFYLKNGFREVAKIPDYYFLGNDQVTFCKKLEERG
ncbi:MAG: GNAT family N-acetyltransferase [Syntrophaceae bacterium]|nr:GNAT family N-acetyltransferase [Syntrophaceae bacterium]